MFLCVFFLCMISPPLSPQLAASTFDVSVFTPQLSLHSEWYVGRRFSTITEDLIPTNSKPFAPENAGAAVQQYTSRRTKEQEPRWTKNIPIWAEM